MNLPDGKLTPAQFEIMQLLWNSEAGMSVVEIWEQIRKSRDVSRNTVLNLVDRLEKRGWMHRSKSEGVYRYCAAVERTKAESQLASEFVQEFFEGSTSNLLMSLIGSNKVSRREIERLKKLLLDDKTNATKPKGSQS